MSHVIFYGPIDMVPSENKKKFQQYRATEINFNFNVDDDQLKTNIEKDYVDQLRRIQINKLQFNSAYCNGSAVFLIEQKRNHLWGFGKGLEQQIGITKPQVIGDSPVNLSLILNLDFNQISVGTSHQISMDMRRKVYAWGDSKYGALGIEYANNFQKQPKQLDPKIFYESYLQSPQADQQMTDNQFYSKLKFLQVFAGNQETFVLTENHLYGFGKNFKSKMSQPNNVEAVYFPQIIQLPTSNIKLQGIAVGMNHCMVWDSNGLIYSWGHGQHGKLGHNHDGVDFDYIQETPLKIQMQDNIKIQQASCGRDHSCAITDEGSILTWGKNDFKFDQDDSKQKRTFIQIVRIKKLIPQIMQNKQEIINPFIVNIISKDYSNAAIDKDGNLYTWGVNQNNCLGLDEVDATNNPLLVQKISKQKTISIAFGDNFSVIIQESIQNTKMKKKDIEKLSSKHFQKIRENIAHIFNMDNLRTMIKPCDEVEEIFGREHIENMQKNQDNEMVYMKNSSNRRKTKHVIPNVESQYQQYDKQKPFSFIKLFEDYQFNQKSFKKQLLKQFKRDPIENIKFMHDQEQFPLIKYSIEQNNQYQDQLTEISSLKRSVANDIQIEIYKKDFTEGKIYVKNRRSKTVVNSQFLVQPPNGIQILHEQSINM